MVDESARQEVSTNHHLAEIMQLIINVLLYRQRMHTRSLGPVPASAGAESGVGRGTLSR